MVRCTRPTKDPKGAWISMSKRLSFAVALLVIALLVAACGGGGSQQQQSSTSSSQSSSTTQQSSSGGQTIQVSLSEFKFTPATITVQRGQRVTITLKNDGTTDHDFRISALGVASTMVPAGGT